MALPRAGDDGINQHSEHLQGVLHGTVLQVRPAAHNHLIGIYCLAHFCKLSQGRVG